MRGPRSNPTTPKDSQHMISYMLVYHPKPVGPMKRFPAHDFLHVGLPSQTSRTNNKRVISTFKFGYTRLNLTTPQRFPAHDFLHVGLPSQTYRTNNNRVIALLSLTRLALKKRPKVKSDDTKRFPAHDFLYVGLPSQTSRTNNKRVISTFKHGCPRLTLKEGPKVKSDHIKRFPAYDFL